MGIVYWMSDPHDGHKNIASFRGRYIPEVKCAETNREFIRKNWRAREDDKVIILGDCCFSQESALFFKSLPGRKELVLGNHDLENTNRPSVLQLADAFDKICGVRSHTLGERQVGCDTYPKEKVWLQHIPIHPQHLRGRRQVHGHEHEWYKDHMTPGTPRHDQNYINVNLDVIWHRLGKIMITTDELVQYSYGDLPWRKHTSPTPTSNPET